MFNFSEKISNCFNYDNEFIWFSYFNDDFSSIESLKEYNNFLQENWFLFLS